MDPPLYRVSLKEYPVEGIIDRMLLMVGVIIYGVKLAFADAWQQLVFLVIGVVLALWVLGAMGISIPSFP